MLHPAAQADGYRRYLTDTNTAFTHGRSGWMRAHTSTTCIPRRRTRSSRRGTAASCGTHRSSSEPILRSSSRIWPSGSRTVEGCRFWTRSAAAGSGHRRRFSTHTAQAIRNERVWELLDEQRVSFNAVLTRVREAASSDTRTVFLIRGGPGTGKSVIAINLLAALSEHGVASLHVTGSRAFTENLRKAVGSRAAAQFKYFNSLPTRTKTDLDVVISDEAHRLREFSWNWRTPKRFRTDVLPDRGARPRGADERVLHRRSAGRAAG